MFDMQKVGRIISDLRKKKNLSQMELANQMGISFQAVSNWERGTSMPDISKLPELSELFGVSIDEILGQESPLIHRAVSGETGEYVREHPEAAAELNEVAPLLTARQIGEAVQEMHQSLAAMENLIPFLDRESQNALAEKAATEHRWDDVERLLPFLSRDLCDKISVQMQAEGDWHTISTLAPFLSGTRLRQLVLEQYEKSGTLQNVEGFLPFLDGKTQETLALNALKRQNWHDVECMAPFLPGEFLCRTVREMIRLGGVQIIDGIAPFLNATFLGELFRSTSE